MRAQKLVVSVQSEPGLWYPSLQLRIKPAVVSTCSWKYPISLTKSHWSVLNQHLEIPWLIQVTGRQDPQPCNLARIQFSNIEAVFVIAAPGSFCHSKLLFTTHLLLYNFLKDFLKAFYMLLNKISLSHFLLSVKNRV